MADVPGLAATRSVTLINQAAIPDTYVGEGTLYTDTNGLLYYKSSTGTIVNISAAGGGGTGTVTSVGLADGSATPIYGITGSPVTMAGTLTFTLNSQTANTVFAAPNGSAGQPTFRKIVPADTTGFTTGTVTSVTFTGDGTVLSATPSAPVTSSGTLTATLAAAGGNTVLASPVGGSTGAPSYRKIIPADTTGFTTGTVTSVGFTGDGTVFNTTVPGSPVTTTGTFAPTLAAQTGNVVLASPVGGGSGAPTYRKITTADTTGFPAGTITALTGDVSASGSGSVTATVNTISGVSASNVANAANQVNAASIAGNVLTATGVANGATFGPASAVAVTSTGTGIANALWFANGAVTAGNQLVLQTSGFTMGGAGGQRMVSNNNASAGTTAYGLNLQSSGMYGSAVNHVSLSAASTMVFDSSSTATTLPMPTTFSTNAVFTGQASAPTGTTGAGTLYTKSSDGNLYYQNGTGATTQLTPGGGASGGAASQVVVVPKTATYNVLAADAGTWFTNTGATGVVTFNLPATSGLTVGYTVYFLNTTLATVSTLKVVPAATDRIYLCTNQPTSATTTLATGFINTSTSRTQSQSIGLTYMAANQWCPTYGYSFDWIVN